MESSSEPRASSGGEWKEGTGDRAMEREEEGEDFEMSDDDERDGNDLTDEGEEGEVRQEGEERDIIESVFREIHAWKGESSVQREGQGGVEGQRTRKGTGISMGIRSSRRKEGDGGGLRGLVGVRRGVSGVTKPGIGRTAHGRRRLVGGWMAGVPENTERTAIEKQSTRRGKRGRRLVDGWMAGVPEKSERTAIEKPRSRRRRRRLVDGWVGGPWEKASSAFQWVNEAGNKEEILGVEAGSKADPQRYYQWQWPVERLGASWHGMFMRGDAGYDIKVSVELNQNWTGPVARLGASWHGMFMRGDARYDIKWPVARLGFSWCGATEYDDTEYDDTAYDDTEYDDAAYDDTAYDNTAYDTEYDDTRYGVKNTPSCKGILPESAYVNLPVWGSDAGVSELKLLSTVQRQQEKQNHKQPVPQDQRDFMLKERWLIWMPRFGLGNSLRAYTSSFIFALLSGRRLLRWHGGNHKQGRTWTYGIRPYKKVSGKACGTIAGGGDLHKQERAGRVWNKHVACECGGSMEGALGHVAWYRGLHQKAREGRVLDRLCNAFYCGVDELQYKGDISRHAKLMDAKKLEIHGFDYSPNVVAVYSGKFFDRLWRGDPQVNQCVHDAFSCRSLWCIRCALSLHSLLFPLPHPFPPGAFFDRLWRGDPQVNQCVHDAFSCRSLWCIRSKVLSLLLGNGPKPGMQDVVDRDLRVVPPLVLRGEEVGRKEGEVTEGKVEPRMVQKGEGLRLQFDVALHIRGHAINVEGDYCIKNDKKCREKAQRGEQVRAHAYMKPRQWRCIVRLMQFLRIKKAAAGGFSNATAAPGRSPNATAAAGGFTNTTAAADGSANATGNTVGVINGKAPLATANSATKSTKGSALHPIPMFTTFIFLCRPPLPSLPNPTA
ncbi:unnamed protein product [Closterium sp. NIES-64]|nr:unnamed protein product [Closterium sp. NIES-64]